MNGRGSFEAWALPAGVAVPAGLPETISVGDSALRFLSVDAPWVEGLCTRLKENGEALRRFESDRLARILGAVGSRFLDPNDPVRREALERVSATSGLSPQMCRVVLDRMAADWCTERLRVLVADALGNATYLDRFRADTGSPVPGRRLRAMGPKLSVQVVAGSVPGVGATAMIRSLLVKGPTLIKPGLGDVVLTTLFAQALREESPTVADAVAVVYWPGGDEVTERAAVAFADVVVAYGSDATVDSIRTLAPVTARFHAYHHRISVGLVGRGALREARVSRTCADVAHAVAFFDQRGCVSPSVIYVEDGGEVSPADFARRLAGAFSAVERELPSGALDAREAGAVHQARALSDMMAATGNGVEVHREESALWTVIFDPSAAFAPGGVGRLVRVKPVHDIRSAPGLLGAFGAHLQTAAATGIGACADELLEALATVGVSRIVPFTDMAFPPPWWKHDGQSPLAPFVRWVETTGLGDEAL